MPWSGPSEPGEYPTLGFQVADLIEAKCAIPDGDRMGKPFILTDEMLRFLLQFYRIDPSTGGFAYPRGAQLCRPQKWGKGPFSAALVCAEADPDGPVRPDGWNADGEPVGRPWSAPEIQVAGITEDNAGNVWRALVPMIELGSISADIPDTGITRINLRGGGLIRPVTSAHLSRIGQRLRFVVQDQTESWTESNKGRALADAQRRNLAGMGGRFIETPNAWDPADESVAQHTQTEPGVYIDDVDPGVGSIRNKAERRRMLRRVYRDSVKISPTEGWVDLDRIEAEIEALLPRDPAQAERWFLNRKRATEGAAFDLDRWKQLAGARDVTPGTLITVGVDGARFDDAVAIVATEVESGYQWPAGIWERPEAADDGYEHPSEEIDGVMVDLFDRFEPWRVYVDPQWIDHLLERWQGRWSDKRVMAWYTNRPRQTAFAVRNYKSAITAGAISNDGNPTMTRHIGNARRRKLLVYDEDHRQMSSIAKDRPGSPRKIDAAMAGVLSWEARGDAIAAGATAKKSRRVVGY